MARARIKHTGTPRVGNAHFRCDKCGKDIVKGQDRYEWSFRYGGTYTRHVACGAPRPSELTQGRVGELYAGQEAIDDALAADVSAATTADGSDADGFESWRAGVVDALNQAAETARELGSEYETAAEAFGGAGENQERYEACDAWADQLEDAAGSAESEDVEEPEPGNDEMTMDEAIEDAMQRVRDHAEGARDGLEL